MCPHESPTRHCVSLFFLAVTFPTSVCMFLGMCLHLWEEGSQGGVGWGGAATSKSWLQSQATHRAAGGQEAITSGSSWTLAEPSQERPSSHSCPTYPQEVPRMGHPHPQGNRALLYWSLASGEGGDTQGLLRVGEGGRNSHGMLGMLML